MEESPTKSQMKQTFGKIQVINFLKDSYGIGNSDGTRKLYKYILYAFNRFCYATYGKDFVDVAYGLKEKPLEEVLDVFVEYKRHLDGKPTKHGNPTANNTKKIHMTVLKKFFRSCGIKVHQDDINDRVTIGRRMRIKKYPLDRQTVTKIIHDVKAFEFKALTTILAGTGARVTEAILLQPSDFDFTSFPVSATIRAKNTKTNEERIVYLTRECADMIQQLINSKPETQPFLFGRSRNPRQVYETYQKAFRSTMRRLGLYKVLDNGFNQITIHSFRQFFRTYAGQIIGRDYSENFIGHRWPLSEYYNFSEEERKKVFLQLEPHLTFMESRVQRGPIEPKVLELQSQIKNLEEKIREIGYRYLAPGTFFQKNPS